MAEQQKISKTPFQPHRISCCNDVTVILPHRICCCNDVTVILPSESVAATM
ncbi:hypothetical protein [Segatella oulorum]|uniref:hypothetical protein n=1 Tax=Segatella oulorum TaxID=28136 RepID=UPI00131EFB19|nr:hypothetical protein [Segatella oulorum]